MPPMPRGTSMHLHFPKSLVAAARTATISLALALSFVANAAPVRAQPVAPSEIDILKGIPWKFLSDVAETVIPTPDGANGFNRGHGWTNVTEQKVTDRLIDAAVVQRNPALVSKMLLVANYAFAHQASDGGFPAPRLTPVQEAASSAFFIRDIAHSMLLLQQSTWFQQSASTASLRTSVAGLEPKVQLGLTYLMNHQSELRSDTGGANRLVVYAGAFYLTGKLFGKSDAIDVGRSFLNEAFSHQSSDGSFLELGGFDSSYQNVSLYEAQIIYVQMAQDDPIRGTLWQAISRGYAREAPSVQSTGELSSLNNTRIGAQSISAQHGGPVHAFDGISAGLAFSYYAGITNDVVAKQRAAQVLSFYFKIPS